MRRRKGKKGNRLMNDSFLHLLQWFTITSSFDAQPRTQSSRNPFSTSRLKQSRQYKSIPSIQPLPIPSLEHNETHNKCLLLQSHLERKLVELNHLSSHLLHFVPLLQTLSLLQIPSLLQNYRNLPLDSQTPLLALSTLPHPLHRCTTHLSPLPMLFTRQSPHRRPRNTFHLIL